VQLHHPDHNHGSVEAARRFEEVQEAYASIQRQRRRTPAGASRSSRAAPPPPPPSSPDEEARLAEIERELLEKARAARERAQRAARDAAAAATSKPKRPSDEELGYIKTDDTLGKILADARKEFVQRLGEVREEPLSHRVADLLDEFGAKLKSDPGSEDDGKRRR
jgi:type IV secretory pathway VirB10-like protein